MLPLPPAVTSCRLPAKEAPGFILGQLAAAFVPPLTATPAE
jgi:hypothetical protein